MLHDLAVKFANCVPARVAIVDHFIKTVQLASLLFRVEAGQVLSGHQLAPQRFTAEADLVRGCRRHTDYVRGVFHGAEDLKHFRAAICLSTAILLLIKLAGSPGAGRQSGSVGVLDRKRGRPASVPRGRCLQAAVIAGGSDGSLLADGCSTAALVTEEHGSEGAGSRTLLLRPLALRHGSSRVASGLIYVHDGG